MSPGFSPEHNSVSHRGSGAPAVERRVGSSLWAFWFGGSRARESYIGVGNGVIWFAAIALGLAAWPVSRGLVYKPDSDFAYYLGVVGGVMISLMLLYSLRKHMRWTQNWGALRYWFMLHMMFGICGPVLILFHSTFHVKSLNAAVSFYSMLLVASSGIIGRFIYTRIHHGLYGQRSNLEEMERMLDINQEKVSVILMAAPEIDEKLKQFRDMALARESAFSARVWKFIALSWRRRKLATHCHQELWRAGTFLAKAQGWDKNRRDQNWQTVASRVNSYLSAVQKAAKFSTYERLFRWWHILHVPFVWLLFISGIIHVVAVHMY